MGLNAVSFWLVTSILLLLHVPPSGAVATRDKLQQLRGSIKHEASSKDGEDDSDGDNDDDDDDDDDDDAVNLKAAPAKTAAQAAEEAALLKDVEVSRTLLNKNLEEQLEINEKIADMDNAAEGNAMIDGHVKAVANETESMAMAGFLGDMWKEMRMFKEPFYKERLMERLVHLQRREPVLRKKYKASLAKMKRQEEASGDKEKVAKLEEGEKEEKKEEKKEVEQKEEKEKEEKAAEEEDVEESGEGSDITGKPPWMKDKKANEAEKKSKKKENPPEDRTAKPDWLKGLESDKTEDSEEKRGKKAKKDKDKEKDGEDKKDEGEPKDGPKEEKDGEDKKDRKTKENEQDKDLEKVVDEEDRKEKEDQKVKDQTDIEKAVDEEVDNEDWDLTGRPPWMKGKKAAAKKDKKGKPEKAKVDDNTVKPDWMKAIEDSQDSDEEDTADDSAEEPEAKKTTRRKAGKDKALFTEKTMPEVSPAVRCTTLLAWSYFALYAIMAIANTINQFTENRSASCVRIAATLDMVKTYVGFAPMLSILFLATRMRAIQLSHGDTEAHKLPQTWVQLAMVIATYGVICQVAVKLVKYTLNYRVDENGLVVPVFRGPSMANNLFIFTETIFLLCIYAGFTLVCVGAVVMPAPKELWGDKPPPVSAALGCTLTLSCLYFFIYLVSGIFRTVEKRNPSFQDNYTCSKVKLLFWRQQPALNLAPMLCILFVVARMRALQIDPKRASGIKGIPQGCMYLCAGAMVTQVTLSILLPLLDRNAQISKPKAVAEQVILEFSNPKLKVLSNLMRYVPLLCIYGGCSVLVASIIWMKAPSGQATPKMSAAVHCVVSLTTLYFAVLTLLYFVQSTLEPFPESSRTRRLLPIFDAGQRTVMFAPMLCLLFMAARMRALQLTRTADNQVPPGAGPQVWVQNAMYFSTSMLFIQVILAYLTGTSPADDLHRPKEDGQAGSDSYRDKRVISPRFAVTFALSIVSHICMLGMLGGAVAVGVGIYSMTPETIPPYHTGNAVIVNLMQLMTLIH